MRNHLVVMAKAPRVGAVKSRLAGEIGAVEAVRFYRVTLSRVLRRLALDSRWDLRLAVTPDAAADAPVWPAGPARMRQGPGDLGARMQRIFDGLPPGPAVIVGSDIPDISAHLVSDAFRALGSADVVFGPAGDGGYWLVGMKRRPRVPRIFAGVRWSTRHALADTCANCGRLATGFVATLPDVDVASDWRRWRRDGG